MTTREQVTGLVMDLLAQRAVAGGTRGFGNSDRGGKPREKEPKTSDLKQRFKSGYEAAKAKKAADKADIEAKDEKEKVDEAKPATESLTLNGSTTVLLNGVPYTVPTTVTVATMPAFLAAAHQPPPADAAVPTALSAGNSDDVVAQIFARSASAFLRGEG